MLKGLFYTFILVVVVITGFMYLTPGPLLKVSGATAERVSFKTIDGVKIKGSYYVPKGSGAVPVFILSHQNNATRAQFHFLVPWLLENGFAALTYDARGFGKSGGDKTDYDHAPYDVSAAVEYLSKDSRINAQKIYGLGASMGANTIFAAAAFDPRLTYGMILSPSNHAIDAIKKVNAADRPRNMTIVATEEDSYASPRALYEYAAHPKHLIMYQGNRHGIQLLQGVKKEELQALLLKLK